MEERDPPYPHYRDAHEVETHDYRVVFWQHQSPPPGISPEMMGWAELTRDLVDAHDVHEVIAWAESYLAGFAAKNPGQSHTYCIYAKLPGDLFDDTPGHEEWLLHVAGINPSARPEGHSFRRMHPFG